jgi:cytochrome c5
MNRAKKTIAFLALLAAAVIFPLRLTAQAPAFLPGILTEDAFPRGCVDCHKNEAGAIPLKLNLMLAKIQGHPKVDALVKVAPKDCGMCHKEGAKMGSLPSVVHKAHFAKKANSQFIKLFQGSCLHCHGMDLAIGLAPVKSGPKNW